MSYNLDDIDTHLANLRSTLRFFTEALEHTDHNSPDWLATDLLSLRNSSGRLQDGLQQFREHVLAEGLAEKKVWVKSQLQAMPQSESHSKPSSSTQPKPQPSHEADSQLPDLTAQAAHISLQAQTPVKSRNRLSLHGSEHAPTPEGTPRPSSPPPRVPSRVQTPNGAPREQTEERNESPQEEYPIQRIDVTEEVQRRLREARLRRLMDNPSTAHKRKFGDMEGVESTGDGAAGEAAAHEETWTARKRVRASGTFESAGGHMKRKEENITLGWEEVGRSRRGNTKRVRR